VTTATGPGARTSTSLDSATAVALVLRFGAGRLRVTGGAPEGVALDAGFRGEADQEVVRDGSRLQVRLQPRAERVWERWDTVPLAWELSLTEDVPVDLEIATGAAQVRADLERLTVPVLRLDVGAADVEVVLPRRGRTVVRARAGLADVRLVVPDGVAAAVRDRSALTGVTIDERRFPRGVDGFRSPEFESAADRVEIDLEGGVGAFSVR
jgi:hypothetical protein